MLSHAPKFGALARFGLESLRGEGYLPAALVMIQRSGRSVPALGPSIARDSRDISINRDAFDPNGDRQRLLGLAEGHARAMPY